MSLLNKMTDKQWERWLAEVREDFPYLDSKIWEDDAFITDCALSTGFDEMPEKLQERVLLTAIHGVYKDREFTEEQATSAVNTFIMYCGLVHALSENFVCGWKVFYH